MKIRTVTIALILTCSMALTAQQRPAQPQASPDHERTSAAATPQANDQAANLARMRLLVQRMQSNLPAVAGGQSPLEHEFQLEIEMWQLLIDQMEMQMKAASPPAR